MKKIKLTEEEKEKAKQYRRNKRMNKTTQTKIDKLKKKLQ